MKLWLVNRVNTVTEESEVVAVAKTKEKAEFIKSKYWSGKPNILVEQEDLDPVDVEIIMKSVYERL